MTNAINLPADKFDATMTFVKPDPAPSRVPLSQLKVLPGFNTRVKDAEYGERVTNIADSIVRNGFFDDKPFAVVMLEGDDTVYIYDGEHRFDAASAASLDGAEFPDGLPVAWSKDGATVKDLTIHLAHGNNGERLNMVELAAVVRRMQSLEMTRDEIAEALGRTTRHVDNLFVLAGANQTVKKAVASGKIAGAEAVKLLRKDPKTAAAKISEAVKKAEERGKAKATPKTMGVDAPKGPKMMSILIEQSIPEGETMGEVLKALAKKIREHIKTGDDDKLLETGMIRVKIEVIDHVAEEAKAEAQRQREEAAEKKAAADADAAAKKSAQKKMLADTVKGDDKAKAPSETKAPRKREKANSAKPVAKATKTPVGSSSTPAPTETEDSGASKLTDESMGGL